MCDILNEIRRMERRYYEKQGVRGKVVCLDANAEARLAASMMHRAHQDPCIGFKIDDILENGIRRLDMKICGMTVFFDCPQFCIAQSRSNG